MAISGPLATPRNETMELIDAQAVDLRQFGLAEKSLAWASPIRLSGRGMRYPAERRRSRAAYQLDGTDSAAKRAIARLCPAAHSAPR